MRLIVTRPEPDASRTADALIRLGHTAILSPMLDIEADAKVTMPRQLFQAVLVTSSNAVRALAGHPERAIIADVPLFAVGDQTALEAKRAGFARARSAGGAVDELVALACRELDSRSGALLYAAGDVQAADLAGKLAGAGFQLETVVFYHARPRTRLSDVAAHALRGEAADGILVYSQRSAAALALALRAQGLAPLGEHVACFCLSGTVAEPLRAVTDGPILVADRPEQISLFAAVERHSRLIG